MKTKSLKRREKIMKHSYGIIGIAFCLLSSGVSAQQVGINLTEESIKPGYTGKSYSPYAQRDFPSRPFFGDHMCTLSTPWMRPFGNTLGLDESWRFARGRRSHFFNRDSGKT